MNRTLDQTAALLGLKPRAFRTRLRELGVLNSSGDLASAHRERGYLFSDPRSRWNPTLRNYTHYSVVLVTGLLLGWIATAFFLIKASKKAFARGFDRGVNLAREQHAASPACTIGDHELMTKITTSLGLAVETWQAFPGTEIMVARVNKQRRQLTAFAAKMWLAAYPAPLNAEDAA